MGVPASAGQDGPWQAQFRAGAGIGGGGGTASVELFAPITQTSDSALFLDLRLSNDFGSDTSSAIGLGVRRIVTPDLMLGGYGYIGVRQVGGNRFTGATLGIEALGTVFDAHANLHIPLSGDRTTPSYTSSLSFVGNRLIEQIAVLNRRDYAMWGIEGEVGMQAPLDLPDGHGLRLHVGGYHFWEGGGPGGSVSGAKAGFEYSIGDVFGDGGNAQLTFGGEVRYDNRDQTELFGSVRLSVPLGEVASTDDVEPVPVTAASKGLQRRLNERVRGDIGVRVDKQETRSGLTRNAINSATNQEYGLFFFANGQNTLGLGTIGDPTTLDAAIQSAGAGGYVVVLGGAGDLPTAGATLAAGQTVIGGGQQVPVTLVSGRFTQAGFGGSNGTIRGTDPGTNVLTLANGVTLSGITVTGGATGIFGDTVTGVRLTDVAVTGAGVNGASFAGASQVAATNFTATGNGNAGLMLSGDGTYTFAGTTTLTGNGGDGLNITGNGTYGFATLNTRDNGGDGVDITSASGRFTTAGGTVSGNGGQALKIDPIALDVVFDTISHNGGQRGITLDDASGTFRVNGATTISGTAGPGISITNSTAAISFNGAVTVSSTGGDGIAIATSSGSVSFNGATTVSSTGGSGIAVTAASGGVRFNGATTVSNSTGDGISLTGNSGPVSFGGATTITNPGAVGVDIEGANGVVSFGSLDIALGTNGTTGLDLSGAVMNGNVTAGDFDLTSTTATGTIGVNVAGTTRAASQTLTLGSATGNGASIAGVAAGVRYSAATNIDIVYGDGESAIDVQSSISATRPIDTVDTLPVTGTYNFRDATLTGDISNLTTTLTVYYVDNVIDGIDDGTRANPGSIAGAAASAAEVIVLVDRTGTDVITVGATTFQLDAGQRLVSFRNGDTVNIGGGAPANFLLTGIAGGYITNPFAGVGTAPTLTADPGVNTVTLANSNLISGVRVTNGAGGASLVGNAITGVTVDGSSFGAFRLTASTGTLTLSDSAMAELVAASGSVNVTGTNADISNAANVATVSVTGGHTGTFLFDASSAISASNGSGLQFDNADGSYTFGGPMTLNGGDAGIDILNGSSGTFVFGAGASITNPTGSAFNVDASAANVTFGGTITQNNAAGAVTVTNSGASTIAFNGLVSANTTTATAINYSANAGGQIAFNGGLAVTTTTGAGFLAQNGGTVTVAATGGAETIASSAGPALSLNNLTANVTLDSLSGAGGNAVALQSVAGTFTVSGATTATNTGGSGILLSQNAANVTFGGLVTTTGTGGAGIAIANATGTVSFNGGATVSNPTGDGISLTGNSGALTFGGTTTITNPGAVGVDIEGTNGAIAFGNLAIALGTDNTTGLDLSGTVMNGNVSAADFDLTSTTATGTTGVSLVGATRTGVQALTIGNTAGNGATIAGVATGVRFSAATNIDTVFGDGESAIDVQSSISATRPIDTVDTLPVTGVYNFRDATLIGDTTNLSTNLTLYYVDNFDDGVNDGSLLAPGTVAGAMASTADVIVLLDRTGGDVITAGAATLQLDPGQRLVSFLNGDTVDAGGGAPANFLLTGITGGTIANPFAGVGTAPTLTANPGFNTVTLGNGSLINGVRITNAPGDFSVFANGTPWGSVTGSDIGALGLNLATGTFTLTDTALSRLSVAGGSVNMAAMNADITNADTTATVSVTGGHTGTITFDASSTIMATNGSGLQFNDADGVYGFNGITSLNGGDAGIDILGGSAGSFTFGSGTSITNPTGAAFAIADSTAGVTYSGSMSQANNADLVSVLNHSAGTLLFQTGTLAATNGSGLQFNNADGSYTFSGTTTLNGGDAGIDVLNGSGGTFGFGAGTAITSPIGTAFNVDASAANVTFGGTITQNNAAGAVTVTNSGASTIAFNGLVSANTTTAMAINYSANAGGQIAFNGGLAVTTTTGAGFFAQNGGTVTVSNSGAAESIASSAGTGISLNNLTANVTLESLSASGGNAVNLTTVGGTFAVTGATTATNTGGAGIVLSQNSANVTFGGLVTTTGTGGAGIVIANATGTVNFDGGVTINNPANFGVNLTANANTITFGGTTTITNPAVSGIDINGTNGAIAFGSIAIALGTNNTTGIDLTGAVLNGNVSAADFDLTSTTATGTTGVNLTGVTRTGAQTLALGAPAGNGATIAGVNVGVQYSAATSVGFTFGDSEAAIDVQSSINATTPIATSDTLPTNGTYNFLDVALTGDTSNLSSGVTVYYVDNFDDGTNNGSRSNPGSIADAIASGRDIIVLVNNGGAIDIASALQGSGTTLTLNPNQRLYSFNAGNSIAIGGGAPASFLLTGIDAGVITNPQAGTPTLLTTAGGATTVTLADNNILQGILLADGPSGFSVTGTGITDLTVNGSAIGGVSLTNFAGTGAFTSSPFSRLAVSGGTGDMTFDAASTLTQTGAASAVSVANKTGGAVTFSGLVTANTATADAVTLTNNAGATISFNAGLNIDTTTGTGFTASGGGTITVAATAGDESITSTTGRAVDLNGIAATITFDSLAAGGGTIGVGLDTVTGTFNVSGLTTIGDATGAGILIQNSAVNATFTGKVTVLNDAVGANGDGIRMLTNSGIYSYNGGVDITVNGVGAYGLRGQSSGTINILDPGGDNQITSTNGTALLINPTIVNATFQNITAGGGTSGVSLTGMTGSLTVTGTMAITGSTGDGLLVSDSPATVSVATLNVSSTGGDGVDLDSPNVNNGAFTVTNGAVSGTAGNGVRIDSGNATVSFGATISKTSAGGAAVTIVNRAGGAVTFSNDISRTGAGTGIQIATSTGGSFTFSGANKTFNVSGANAAVLLNINPGATIDFTNGGLALTSDSGTAFSSTGGGTVTVQGAGNTITTNTGVALNLSGVTVAAGGVTFQSATKTNTGGTSAIVLDTVTGAGAIALGTGSLAGGSGATVRIGDGAGGANTGGTVGLTYAGTIASSTAASTIDIQDRAAGAQDITLSGTITHNVGGSVGISLADNAAGTITFSGATKSITTDASTGVIVANVGGAVVFSGGGLDINSNSGTGLLVTGAGSLTISGGGNTIDSASGTAFANIGSSATIASNAALTVAGGGRVVDIQNRTAGNVTLSGNLSNVGAGALGIRVNNVSGGTITMSGAAKAINAGVALTGNGGAAIDFTGGGLVINAASGAGFSASGGGAITVQGAGNTITTATGEAFTLSGVTVAAGGITFASTTKTTTGGTGAVALSNVTGAGAVALGSGSLAGGSGATVRIGDGAGGANTGGTVALTYAGSIASSTADSTIVIHDRSAGAQDITLSGSITHSGTNGTGVSLYDNAAGTITFSGGAKNITTTSGTGLSIANTGASVVFSGGGLNIDTTSGAGIGLSGSGSTTISGGGNTVDTTIGTAFLNSGGNATVSSDAALTTAGAGRVVDIQNRTAGNVTLSGNLSNTGGTGSGIFVNANSGGTITFSGASKTISAGASTGVTLSSNTGAAINFTNGGLVLNTTSGTGFSATGGGTVTVQGAGNSITSTTGTALAVANTTIGAGNMTFQSISANGAVNGIVLNNTGASGSLIVTGSGSTAIGGDNSGGTIQNTTGSGIVLTNTLGPSFTNMRILNTTGHGIRGTDVTNFTFSYGRIDGSNVDADATTQEANISFGTTAAGTENNLDGTVTIVGNVLTNAQHHGIDIFNFSGTISNLTITNNTITSATAPASSQGSGIRVIAFGSAGTVANISQATINANTITNFPGGVGIQVQGGNANIAGPATGFVGVVGSGTDVIRITNNVISGQSAANRIGGEGIVALVNGRGQGNFLIDGNQVTHTTGTAITMSSFGFANVAATLSNNTINANNSFGSQGIGAGTGMTFTTADTPTLTTLIQNNAISNTDGNGILVVARGATGTVNARILNNIVAAPLGGVRPGIRVDAGNASSVNDTINLEISGNTSAGSGGSQGIGLRKQGTAAGTNVFRIVGLTPSPNTLASQVVNHINALNPAGNGTLLISAETGFTSIVSVPSPLMAEGSGVMPEGEDLWGGVLTGTTLDSLIAAAIGRWEAAGLTVEQRHALSAATFEITDIGGGYLGLADAGHIRLDDDGAGFGWFVDLTPDSDEEFANQSTGTQLHADGTQAPAGQYDLLTVIMHEMGHVLGLSDTYVLDQSAVLMYGQLGAGERRLPTPGDGLVVTAEADSPDE